MIRRDRLVIYALCILQDAIDDSARGATAVPPTVSLRLALGFLYAAGDRRNECFDREPYDDFWRSATSEPGDIPTPHMGRVIRFTTLHTCLDSIARAAGVPHLTAVSDQICRSRRKV